MDNNQNNMYKQSYDYNQQYNSMAPQPNGISLAAMICGIAGFVTGYGASIAALILSNIYKNKNNGQHCKQSRIGFTCGLISLILWIVGIFAYIIFCAVVGAMMGEM